MDETKTWWFKAIAKHGHGLFAVVWGMGLGNFLAVVTKAVDVSGYTLTFYLAITTALMGGLLSVLSSRAMDIIADRRKTRRKLYAARISIEELISELIFLLAKIDEVRAGRIGPNGPQRKLTTDEALAILVRKGRVNQACQEPPDLDELVESEIDLQHARSVRSRYLYLQDHTAKLTEIPTEEWISKADTSISDLSRQNLAKCISTLTEARTYLEDRTSSG